MRVFGNLMNRIAETIAPPVPEVGMGATILMFTDRIAATVIKVDGTKTRVSVQEDKATRTDENGLSDAQDWCYQPNPRAPIQIFSLRENGTWVKMGESMRSGTILRLGVRDHFYDFSF